MLFLLKLWTVSDTTGHMKFITGQIQCNFSRHPFITVAQYGHVKQNKQINHFSLLRQVEVVLYDHIHIATHLVAHSNYNLGETVGYVYLLIRWLWRPNLTWWVAQLRSKYVVHTVFFSGYWCVGLYFRRATLTSPFVAIRCQCL